jgi:hypothetical protein
MSSWVTKPFSFPSWIKSAGVEIVVSFGINVP